MPVSEIERKKIANRFNKDEEVSRLMGEAVRRALAEHKRKSNSIAVWRNGKVVIVPSEQIPVQKPKDELPPGKE
jgi:hypothetical protein